MRASEEVGWGGAQAELRMLGSLRYLNPSKDPEVQLPSPYTLTQPSWPRDRRDRVPAVLGRLRQRDANDPDVISGGLGLEPPLKRDRKWLAKADFRNLDLPATHCPSQPRPQSRGYLLLMTHV